MSPGNGLHLRGGSGDGSSSPELSSPPAVSETEAPPSPSPTPNAQSSSDNSDSAIIVDNSGVGSRRKYRSTSAAKPGRSTSHTASAAQPTTRKQRKKKDKDVASSNKETPAATAAKESKTRKVRGTGATTTRKRKLEVDPVSSVTTTTLPTADSAPAPQTKITELVNSVAPTPQQQSPHHQNFHVPTPVQPAQNGKNEAITKPNSALPFHSPPPPPHPPPQSQPRPQPQLQSRPPSQSPSQPAPAPVPAPTRSSGQNFDPIRSTTIEASATASTSQNANSHHPFSPPAQPNATPPRSQFRASASPAISSIIDPPSQPSNHSIPSQPPLFSQPSNQPINNGPATAAAQLSSTSVKPPSTLTSPYQPATQHSNHLSPPVPAAQGSTASNEPEPTQQTMAKPSLPSRKSGGTSTGPPSNAASPKPTRQKEAAPPIAVGSGLLSSALFGGVDESTRNAAKAPSIIIHVPLNGEINKVVNFAQLAEEKYGFAALHPRIAAQKERMARMAAASAALEKSVGSKGGTSVDDSGDELENVSLDNSEDPERADRDVTMGGTSGAESKQGGVKRRKRKVEDYDREDPFVDDTELAWEEQAAASKDGFFVYSGPLVPEGEKPQIERADGTVKRGRGRGRGGGPGSRGGRGGATTGGPGSRGGGATRKPRISKAQRYSMEREKIDREKMAVLAAKPAGYPG